MQAQQLDQALEGIKAIGGLAAGSIVIYIAYVYSSVIHTDARARAPGGYGGMIANDWITTGLTFILPATLVFLAFFGLLVRAIYSRRY